MQSITLNYHTPRLMYFEYLAWQKELTEWRKQLYMNPRETKLFQCIKESILVFAGTMFCLLPKPLFRDLYEKLHQAFGKLDRQVDRYLLVCSQICPKSLLFVILRFGQKIPRKTFCPQGRGDSCLFVFRFAQKCLLCYSRIRHFSLRGEGIAFSEKTLQVIFEMFLIMIIIE